MGVLGHKKNTLDRLSLWDDLVLNPHVDWYKDIIQRCDNSNEESVNKREWIPGTLHVLGLRSQLHPKTRNSINETVLGTTSQLDCF